jgi:hypothetical protein
MLEGQEGHLQVSEIGEVAGMSILRWMIEK